MNEAQDKYRNVNGLFLETELAKKVQEDNELEKFKKEFGEDSANVLLEESKKFELYFQNLHNELKSRYKDEIHLYKELNYKADLIQELMDTITKALHDAKYNYRCGDVVDRSMNGLKGTFTFFESKMQNLYFNNVVSVEGDKKDLDYFYFGSLVASGQVTGIHQAYNYKLYEGVSARELAEVLKCNHQYINDTFSNGTKSIYTKRRYENIIDYCNRKKLEVKDSFHKKYNDLKPK